MYRHAGGDTLVACWRALAQLSPGPEVAQLNTTVVALFPSWAALNNAVLHDAPSRDTAGSAAAELTPLYEAVDVRTWALWLPTPLSDLDAPGGVSGVEGLTRDTTTLVMTRTLEPSLGSHLPVARTSIQTATRATDEPVPKSELSEPDDVPGLAGWALLLDGAAAGGWSCLHGTDCGHYAVGTVPGWRRRGLAAALVRHVLADAWSRGARTASCNGPGWGSRLRIAGLHRCGTLRRVDPDAGGRDLVTPWIS